jgi:hypothetical protein
VIARAFVVAFALVAVARAARADVPGMFGPSPTSAGLARADVADPLPTDAPRQNAGLASEPGLRLAIAYGYAGLHLQIDDAVAPLDDAGGVTLSAQYAKAVEPWLAIGGAASVHLPDRYLAKISFEPASQPQLLLYGAALDRASFDFVVAARLGGASIGGGVAMSANVNGLTTFDLAQDARGTYADGGADVALQYRATPIAGVSWKIDELARVGANFRGPVSTELDLESVDTIAVTGNPLNGATNVFASGIAGFDPARADLAVTITPFAGLRAMLAFEYAAWGGAPRPVADVSISLALDTTPSARRIVFADPALRDTLSPRLGVELTRPLGSAGRAWTVRAGYSFDPSPVPKQSGFTSYADADRHEIALGAGLALGKWLDVAWSIDAAGQLHLLDARSFEKPDPSLPRASYDVSGAIGYGAMGLTAVLP